MEEQQEGMTDRQYSAHLRDVISELERVKRLGVSNEASAEIDALIARYKTTIGD